MDEPEVTRHRGVLIIDGIIHHNNAKIDKKDPHDYIDKFIFAPVKLNGGNFWQG